jgi:hypothetical protein
MHGTAAAVLVHSAEEQPDQTADSPFLPLLNQAAPGQILLTEKPCKFLHDLPGFSLRATSEAGLQELLWRGPEVESARCFDEQSLAQLIEQHGLEVEAEAESKESSTTDPGSTTGVGDAGPPAQSGSKNVLLAALRSLPLGGKSLWLIGGACTAAFFVALVVIIALSHRNAPSSRIVATPKTETISSLTVSGSLAPATPVGQSVNPTKSGTENQATASQTRVRTPKDSRKKGVKPNPSARCDLDPHELLDELDTAERSLARGHYDDADRQFSAVLACEPGNGRARAGLERSRKAQTER